MGLKLMTPSSRVPRSTGWKRNRAAPQARRPPSWTRGRGPSPHWRHREAAGSIPSSCSFPPSHPLLRRTWSGGHVRGPADSETSPGERPPRLPAAPRGQAGDAESPPNPPGGGGGGGPRTPRPRAALRSPNPARAPDPTHHGSGAGPAAASGRGGGFRSAAATAARQSTEKPSGSGRRRRRARQSIPELSIDAQRFPRPQKLWGPWEVGGASEEGGVEVGGKSAAGAAATNHPSWMLRDHYLGPCSPARSSAARPIHLKWLETTPAIPVPVSSTFVMPSQALNRVQHSYWTIIYVGQLCTLQNAYHMKIKPEEIFLSPHTTWQQSAALPVPFAPPGQVSVTACAQDWSSGQSQRTRGESLF
ncbi:uncharacterized protein [Canis lupus baileyi]|uniref:uncharacterized protein n=1 Tax=Canis lupus baileyi TaxID=143281 RepID=UPI003B96BCA2